ncbi:MAG: endolytic transglycosylase MltG [Betaproteobacteria bacterium]|nr:endolytic transglycosylase MltG [Betaproteobacteria bacterium]
MRALIRGGLVLALLAAMVAGAVAWWLYDFAYAPLKLTSTPFEFTVARGASLKAVDRQLYDAGILPRAQSLWWLGRITDKASGIQAGRYRLDKPLTPLELFKKMNEGDVVPVLVTFVEGITFAEMRAQLERDTNFKVTLKGLSDSEVLKRVGVEDRNPEGWFAADTFRFTDGATDTDVLKLAHQTQKKRLMSVWDARQEGLPYKSPYEALIMASIIEKETGKAEERPLIASVFVNRLRVPMRLQTDPTVIYGMGLRFDGNIRKRDLTADTPYNTYTRDGLPPTPIAMPGLAAIQAALNPAKSDRLYFVAKGDGSHYFSATLEEHNRAVRKYQLRQ